jgi:DNA-binding CsgD family transcriptional regulator
MGAPPAPLHDDRLFDTLQQLLAIPAPGLRPALDQASSLVNTALRADKVDVFLYDPDTDSLVAMGTSATPLGQRQYQLGLNRQPLANGGSAARVFQTDQPYRTGQADQDPDQLRGVVQGLGVRSAMDVPLAVNGERRGVLQADATAPEHFTARDLRFLQAVAAWIGMVTERAELFERGLAQALQQGRLLAGEEVARLTPRQREVAVCIAEGLSNEELAERLSITPGTAANHVEHMLDRLGLRSRTQIAVWAVERGLYRAGQQREGQ